MFTLVQFGTQGVFNPPLSAQHLRFKSSFTHYFQPFDERAAISRWFIMKIVFLNKNWTHGNGGIRKIFVDERSLVRTISCEYNYLAVAVVITHTHTHTHTRILLISPIDAKTEYNLSRVLRTKQKIFMYLSRHSQLIHSHPPLNPFSHHSSKT